MYNFIRKFNLKNDEIQKYYSVISNSFADMGIIEQGGDYQTWKENLIKNIRNKQFYYYSIIYNGRFCGFFSLYLSHGDKLFLSDIYLKNELKGTRCILKFIEFIINNKEFSRFNEIYFAIKKTNLRSIKTFVHLGAEVVDENKNSKIYKLNRKIAEEYVKNFNK